MKLPIISLVVGKITQYATIECKQCKNYNEITRGIKHKVSVWQSV